MRKVIIGHLDHPHQFLSRQGLIGRSCDRPKKCLIILANNPLPLSPHIVVEVFFPDGAAEKGESI